MTFGAPIWLAAAGVAAAAVVGLHLLARRPPRTYFLPTARFVPDRPARATAPTTRPSDLPVLLLRVAALLLLGAAFARPLASPPHRARTIVTVDRSRSAATLDSAAVTEVRRADRVIAFDSTATMVQEGGAVPAASRGRGSLSTALVAAMRAASELARSADSIELVVISPFMAEEWDEATLTIRQAWPGRIRLVPMAPAAPAVVEGGGLRASTGDPMNASVVLLGNALPSGTRLVRTAVTADDSAWAAQGGTLVYWPMEDSAWSSQPGPATGVVAGLFAAVAPFGHRVVVPPGGVVARWADGMPAATEHTLGAGCERDVGIPIPVHGDVALRPSVLRLVRQLSAPCGGPRGAEALSAAQLESLRGGGAMLASASIPFRDEGRTPASLGLLVAAGVLLLLELLLRRHQVAR